MRRRNWQPDEDRTLLQTCGELTNHWRKISKRMAEQGFKRNSKSCKERYYNYLNPDVSRERWTPEEIAKLFELQNQYGNRWRKIASELPHRTDCIIKNQFYSIVRKVLRRLYKVLENSKTGSKVTKDIKPSVLSRIFCVQNNESDGYDIPSDFAVMFKQIILKYKDFQSRQSVEPEDVQFIKLIFETLQNLNQSYNEHCKLKKKIKKTNLDCDIYKEKYYIYEQLLSRVHKRKAIFTSDTYGIEKLYKKFMANCAFLPSSLVYKQIPSKSKETNICFTPQFMSTEQFLYFQSMPSFYVCLSVYLSR